MDNICILTMFVFGQQEIKKLNNQRICYELITYALIIQFFICIFVGADPSKDMNNHISETTNEKVKFLSLK